MNDKIEFTAKKIDELKGILSELNIELKQEINRSDLFSVNEITNKTSRMITTAFLHQDTFKKFKNCNVGKKVAVVGAGPTLNRYKLQKDTLHIGLNRAFLKEDVEFDYLFAIDILGIDFCKEAFFDYRPQKCIKFIGDQNAGKDWQIPENFLYKNNIYRYKTTAGFMPDRIALDIDTEPLGNYYSVSLQAMQFALYTNPNKVYLVGIDCTTRKREHFTANELTRDPMERGENISNYDDYSIEAWKEIKSFANTYYPETEIISVNPVGLKGIFTDVYSSD